MRHTLDWCYQIRLLYPWRAKKLSTLTLYVLPLSISAFNCSSLPLLIMSNLQYALSNIKSLAPYLHVEDGTIQAPNLLNASYSVCAEWSEKCKLLITLFFFFFSLSVVQILQRWNNNNDIPSPRVSYIYHHYYISSFLYQ